MSEKKTVTVAGETGDPARRPGQRCLGLFGLHPGPPGEPDSSRKEPDRS